MREVSYKKLRKLLIDKNMEKKDIAAHFSPATSAKLWKNEYVSMDVLRQLCELLDCDIGDILSFEETEPKNKDEVEE